jgi:hypothetical protein
MNRKLAASAVATAVCGTATALGLGLLSTSSASATGADLVKREEGRVDLVLVDDLDDDDTNDRGDTSTGGGGGSTFTGHSQSTNDGTNSRFTAVSRDRDYSRSDKTRDWTRDGSGDRKRDWSAGRTNDRSRNDTRR